jgi:hypothetical protein
MNSADTSGLEESGAILDHNAQRPIESEWQCLRLCECSAPSFNGRTPASGAGYRGSNPWGAAKSFIVVKRWTAFARRPDHESLERPLLMEMLSPRWCFPRWF